MKTDGGPKKQFIASPSNILQQVRKTFLPIEMSDACGANSMKFPRNVRLRNLNCRNFDPRAILVFTPLKRNTLKENMNHISQLTKRYWA